jgi:hypothetical protein
MAEMSATSTIAEANIRHHRILGREDASDQRQRGAVMAVHRFAQHQRRVDRGQLYLGVVGGEVPGGAFCQRLGLVVGRGFGVSDVGPVLLGEGAALGLGFDRDDRRGQDDA